MKNNIFSLCRVFLCCFLLLAAFASGLPAAEKKAPPDKKKPEQVQINFPDIDLNVLINLISQMTGKNFIVDPAVKGKVTIIAPDKISVSDAYRVFESVLEVHGFATVPSGSVIKIVPAVHARSKSIPTVIKGETSRTDDKIVTRIISVANISPEEVRKILAPLLSKTSLIIPHEQSKLLIIADALSNINRLMEIITAMDVPADGEELEIIPLRHASVESIVKSAGQLFTQTAARRPGAAPAQNFKIIPYERTNSLIVFGSKEQILKFKLMLEQLDVAVTSEGGNIHVYTLQHANAEEMVKVLTSLPSGKPGGDLAKNVTAARPKAGEEAKAETAAAPSVQLSTDIKITADPETNTLIITASKEEYMVLEEVIRKLDVPRRMVYLEALIMEVSIDKQFEIGAEWGGLGSFHDETGTLGAGFTKNKFSLISGVSKGTAGMANGATLGILKKGVKIGGAYFPDIGSVVNAFQKDSDINIIATPQILTTDNKEANITVGENVPYITSKNSSSTGSTQDYTNYEYKDVGTTLKITPQINQANLLRLDIAVEVTRLKSEAGVATPTTYKRSAATTVVVHNQEIVVIGGMIGQDATSGDYKVPLLGDIPLLGWLFKTHENSGRKTNMFIFIAPRIVNSAPELADLYYKKRDKLEEVKPGSGAVPEQLLKNDRDVEHAYALMDQGFLKLQNKDYGEARKYFQQALQSAPDNPYALFNLGAAHAGEGSREQAEAAYEQTLEQVKHGGKEDAVLLAAVRARLRQLRQAERRQAAEKKEEPPKEPAAVKDEDAIPPLEVKQKVQPAPVTKKPEAAPSKPLEQHEDN
uniref:type II secretion system secretin GspD n=1 Tax=Candidatus Electronema sp. TaxID=2698783 RepID=UPI004055F5B8